ncbi:MAG: hypothetical protein ACLFUN_00130 [Desulfobacterales bacterium]
MKANSLYKEAHLIVAAIRVLEYRNEAPPRLEDVAGLLSVSAEEAARLCRRLGSMGIIETIEKSGETRLFIADHLRIEDIDDRAGQSSISAELEKFRRQKQNHRKTIDELKSGQEQKRKKIQEEIERKFKDNLPKGKDRA